MLVLSRKENEQITITDGTTVISVMLCSLRGNRARIGIVAPKNWSVSRPDDVPEQNKRDTAHASV